MTRTPPSGCAPRRARARLSSSAGAILVAMAAPMLCACTGSSARLLEPIDAANPPGSTLRMDVLLLRSVSGCAVGNGCTREDDQCFYLEDAGGARTGVRIALDNTLRFVLPNDPLTKTADAVACFTMALDDDAVASAKELLSGLRTEVFRNSGGDINLDLQIHELARLDALFYRFGSGLFLDPQSLQSVGLPLLSRETDFVYAITGFADSSGIGPRLEYCAGTNWLRNGEWDGAGEGVLGASPFTWLAMNGRCARPATFLSTWIVELYFANRDLNGQRDPYNEPDCGDGACYPACGEGNPDPTSWFPRPSGCTADPDAPACGRVSCPDVPAYHAHILSKHWQRGRTFTGSYCDDGRMDFDETGIDSGGVCDRLGR